MKSIFLVKNSKANNAFEIRETEKPTPKESEVLIKVEAFGLNYADIMARQGIYPDCPKLPAVIGYDVAGTIAEIGRDVKNFQVGDSVCAMTRFGGYSEMVVSNQRAVAKLPEGFDYGKACALTTQYSTAYFAAVEMIRLRKGANVLIHAASGGVGTALVQIAAHFGCNIYGTMGSAHKFEYFNQNGGHFSINYREDDYVKIAEKKAGKKQFDIIFNPIGGSYVKKDLSLLNSGGRLVLFGASDLSNKNLFGKLASVLGFGIYHPLRFMDKSQALIGVNMLRIADHNPNLLSESLAGVVELLKAGKLKPHVAKTFKAFEIAAAHQYMESRQSMGKIVCSW